jgi:hypothetical protein
VTCVMYNRPQAAPDTGLFEPGYERACKGFLGPGVRRNETRMQPPPPIAGARTTGVPQPHLEEDLHTIQGKGVTPSPPGHAGRPPSSSGASSSPASPPASDCGGAGADDSKPKPSQGHGGRPLSACDSGESRRRAERCGVLGGSPPQLSQSKSPGYGGRKSVRSPQGLEENGGSSDGSVCSRSSMSSPEDSEL